MPLATLSIDLEARIGQLQQGLDRAGRLLQKQSAEMSARWDSVGASVKGVAVALGGLASVSGLSALFLTTVKTVDGFNDLADATGASIENISALENVARRNGGTLEDVSGILVKFNAALKESAPGSAAARAIEALGLSVKELKTLDPAEALRRVAVALDGYADDGNKARLVQELFGKSIREAAPFLKDLAEAGQLNATVTREQAQEAERFNKALAAMRTSAQDLHRQIAGDLVPALQEIFDRLNGVDTLQRKFSNLAQAILVPFEALSVFGANVSFVFQGVGRDIGAIAAQLVALGRLDFKGFAAIGQFAREDAAAARKALDDLERRLLGGSGASTINGGRGFLIPPLVGGAQQKLGDISIKPLTVKASEVTDSQRALATYVEQLQRVIGKTQELTQEQQALDFLKGLGKDGEIPQVRAVVLGLAQQVDFQKALNDDLEDERKLREQIARIQGEHLAEQGALNRQIDEFTGSLEEARKVALTARLEARLAAGEAFSPEQLERAVKGIGGIKDEVGKVTDAMAKQWEQFAENVQDAFGETISRTLQGDFDDIGKLWKNMLLRMAGEAIAADLSKRLFGDLFKAGGGGVFKLLTSALGLFGFAKGGAFGAGGQRLALANGGVLTGPTPFAFAGGLGVAGEAGAEAVMPLRRGRNGQLGVVAQGGGGAVVTTINVAAGVQRGEVVAAVQLGMQQVEGRIMQRLRHARVL